MVLLGEMEPGRQHLCVWWQDWLHLQKEVLSYSAQRHWSGRENVLEH